MVTNRQHARKLANFQVVVRFDAFTCTPESRLMVVKRQHKYHTSSDWASDAGRVSDACSTVYSYEELTGVRRPETVIYFLSMIHFQLDRLANEG